MNEIPYHKTGIGKWWQQRMIELYDEDACPDCGSHDIAWIEGTYYEQGERHCNKCNPTIETMFDDTRYDEMKELK